MKNVLILGATGNIAQHVTGLLAGKAAIQLTLFVRSARRLRHAPATARVVEGDVLNYDQLSAAVAGQDIVYANLSGDLERMAQNIVKAMNETGVQQVIFISSIGIYAQPLKPVLKPYRGAADVLENSTLAYTILRPAWFTSANEVDYEITQKGEPERGSVISQKSLATFITQIIESPEQYARQNMGISNPNS
ncbi:NAD(P)H-binding protein [Hymenobacter sp. DH14]|uniref:NAD(P)H-binding protein n=1 Tax=Hymenobacter cyanobacteriorum TaxID=2926463 RepID=A0A9X1VN34_9BACT|nr:NAD(P)H-binding protein [Hymenobacter cyanobacteriorum]MCI1189146.1 NAD(P)H-binding protein [Hymenobacter cyanobacteriorum]